MKKAMQFIKRIDFKRILIWVVFPMLFYWFVIEAIESIYKRSGNDNREIIVKSSAIEEEPDRQME
jgi:hypothetical protein